MFYHGYDNYMRYAFPEDEIRPLSCMPLTRDRHNPAHIELNDALGNYSLTLIDSLSTLAIMASAPEEKRKGKKNKALRTFQDGVKALVEQYGDGTDGPKGEGKRARGFDVDSKVQVFETVIRGVGGLISAHQFAVGDLPISGYKLKARKRRKDEREYIKWPNKFDYDGQLLRLAEDLAVRILPAFVSPTGLPYPRVNLRYGIPFYPNSPLNSNIEDGECPVKPPAGAEITETCSAGAGSLVLEFTTLSRLTGDPVYEEVAKLAFWAVWERKATTGLVGSGIDAETGYWTQPYTGIGAGIDSFYEYAAKASILLSGSPTLDGLITPDNQNIAGVGQAKFLEDYQQTAGAFQRVWQESHAAIKKHLYRGHHYTSPHFVQSDLFTGAERAFWVDSLSAFYPGTLAMMGELEEAVEIHLLPTALWTRYSALPERWSVSTGGIEGGLGWWAGRPEYIESTYYLYLATDDPWYLHVGEMVLRDVKRRCWTKCGFSGLQDVKTGQKNDRMESFFLGETTKYLFLLFTPEHPLNKMDAPFVFSTEGHPLIISKSARQHSEVYEEPNGDQEAAEHDDSLTCPSHPAKVPFSLSYTAARGDVFHAAKLARLDQMPSRDTIDSVLTEYSHDHPSITMSDIQSPSNFTYYPWTLPLSLVPTYGISKPLQTRMTLDLTFPALPNTVVGPQTLQRVSSGIYVTSMSGLRLSLIQDVAGPLTPKGPSTWYRIQAVNHLHLGFDERVYLPKPIMLEAVNPTDPNFTLNKDAVFLDIVVDVPPIPQLNSTTSSPISDKVNSETQDIRPPDTTPLSLLPHLANSESLDDPTLSSLSQAFSLLLSNIGALLSTSSTPTPPAPTSQTTTTSPHGTREYISAILPSGAGAAPLPDVSDALAPTLDGLAQGRLEWSRIWVGNDGCTPLPAHVPREYEIILLKRGTCTFGEKLTNIPTHVPTLKSLRLVILVSFPENEEFDDPPPSRPKHRRKTKGKMNGKGEDEGRARERERERERVVGLTRPALDEQVTSTGMRRRHPISMLMVGGGQETWEKLARAAGIGVKRRYWIGAQGVRVANLVVL